MQQLESFPELTTETAYLDVEYTDGEDVYVSKPAHTDESGLSECYGCAFEQEYLNDGVNCYESATALDCAFHPIIWVKKG